MGKTLHIAGSDANQGHWKRERVTPRKSLQSSLYLGQAGSWGRSRALSGFSVIVSLLIKAKSVCWIVSLCHRLLLDICCFQVKWRKRLKTGGWICSPSQPHSVSNQHAKIWQIPALILATLCRPNSLKFVFIADSFSALWHSPPLEPLWIFRQHVVHWDGQQSLRHVIEEWTLLLCYKPNKWLTNCGGKSAPLSH